MPYCHFAFPAGPTPPPDSGTWNFPESLAHLSQSTGISGSVVTVTRSSQCDHVTMLVTVVTVDHLPCCNAPLHKVIHNVQLPKKEATVTIVPPHARGG